MIAQLRGTVVERHPTAVVLDVHGVGYALLVSVSTYSQVPPPGEAATLLVHTHVREDALLLYGFATAAEKALFEKLITVNGVGPKLALSILSGLAPEALSAALRNSDLARLTGIPGVGKKTAERLVVELRDKIPAAAATEVGSPAAQASAVADDVVSALVNLGYAQPLAQKAVQRALAQHPEAGFDRLFTECMKRIGG